jgi:KDO2-lipid IV(A) lauroyltransferase
MPLVAFLPAPLAYAIAVLRGDVRYHLDKSLREEMTYVLKEVLGDQVSDEDCVRVVRDFFRLRSCETVDVMRLADRGRSLARLVNIRGLEHIEAALAAGKGAILCSAHFGSFRSCFSLLGYVGFPVALIGRWSYFDDSTLSPISRLFRRLTLTWPVADPLQWPNLVRRKGAFGVAIQAALALRQNKLIGIMVDWPDLGDPLAPTDRAEPVRVEFLKQQALMQPGAFAIAQLTGAPVLLVLIRRSRDWRHQVLEISPPISTEGDTITLFRRCLAALESAICRDTAHWVGWLWANDLQLSHVWLATLRRRNDSKFELQEQARQRSV